jgi:hypothetical protein
MVNTTTTPFVNRARELCLLSAENAQGIVDLDNAKLNETSISGYSSLNFCFSAQLFGTGKEKKNRLGQEFVEHSKILSWEVLLQHLPLNVDESDVPKVKEVLNRFHSRGWRGKDGIL